MHPGGLDILPEDLTHTHTHTRSNIHMCAGVHMYQDDQLMPSCPTYSVLALEVLCPGTQSGQMRTTGHLLYTHVEQTGFFSPPLEAGTPKSTMLEGEM